VHIMDDKQRIALVETRIQGNDGSPLQLIRYQFGNHLGSASLELDDLGQIISYEEYYPYGSTSYQAVRSGVEASPKRYRHIGMERDEESGFNHHGARYYATWLGRWVSCDPIGISDGLDIYTMARNNPIRNIDRSGRDNTETTYVTPRVRADLQAANIKYAEQVVFDLLDDKGKVTATGRFDIVFRDPRPGAGGRLIIPELKGKNINELHSNQFDYLPQLESKGGTIRIRATKASQIDIPRGKPIKLVPDDFFRVGTENLEDFSSALREIAAGKPITNKWVGRNGEVKLFTSEAEAHEFFRSQGIEPVKTPTNAPTNSVNSSSAAGDTADVASGAKVVKAVDAVIPTAKVVGRNESKLARFVVGAGEAGGVLLKGAKFAGEVRVALRCGETSL
jgi:RHS repeat-associated protein